MKKLFRTKAKIIWVYVSQEREIDPYEHTKKFVNVLKLPVRALVFDLTENQLIWKMPGIETSRGKILILEKDKLQLIKNSQYIEVDGEKYLGWRGKSGKELQYKLLDKYMRVYLYKV